MKPFFESWKTSSHNKFECSLCHYPPGGGVKSKLRKKVEGLVMVGRYWTKLYLKSKPWAEIRDESCLRQGCHEKRLLEGKVRFKKIIFDHRVHFSDLKRGKRLQCTSCHSQIVQGEHITVTESSCFICHFKRSEHYPQIDNCLHCHQRESLSEEGSSSFKHALVIENGISCEKCHTNTILGEGEVPRENCYKCHWEEERLKRYDDTDLMHETHIYLHKVECNQCHLEIQHKIVKNIEAIAECTSCHAGHHLAQKILFTGEGGKGIPHPKPNLMLEKGLSCKGCHFLHEEEGRKKIKSETLVSGSEACSSCHGKGFSRILKEWELSTNKKIGEIRSLYLNILQELKMTKHPQKKNAESLLEDALFNIELVEKGKSVHNMSYSLELLSAAYKMMVDALRLIESPFTPPSFEVLGGEIPSQCITCHEGIEEISSSIFGLTFSHKTHVLGSKIGCDSCHLNLRRHGELVTTKKSCAPCHHEKNSRRCEECHLLQKTFYQGGKEDEFIIPEDRMASAGVGCSDCHLERNNLVYRSDRNKCGECHEDRYKEIFDEWQSTTRTLLNSCRFLLKEKKEKGLGGEYINLKLNEAHKLIEKFELDGSLGVHNFNFTEESLTALKKKLESIQKSRDEKKKFH